MKTLLLLFALAITAKAQSTCSVVNGLIHMRPAVLATEVVVETSTDMKTWFISVHVWGERPCADLEFVVPKTKEPVRYWRLRIIK